MTEKELPDHETYKIIPVSLDVDEAERQEMFKTIKELGHKILLTTKGTKVSTDTIVIVPPLE